MLASAWRMMEVRHVSSDTVGARILMRQCTAACQRSRSSGPTASVAQCAPRQPISAALVCRSSDHRDYPSPSHCAATESGPIRQSIAWCAGGLVQWVFVGYRDHQRHLSGALRYRSAQSIRHSRSGWSVAIASDRRTLSRATWSLASSSTSTHSRWRRNTHRCRRGGAA